MSGYTKNRKSGLTLIEVLVTGMIGAILITGIFTTFSVVGTATEEVTALQQLGLESAYIDEYVSKWISMGNYVTVDPSTVVQAGIDTAQGINIYDTSGVFIRRFRYSGVGDSLMDSVAGAPAARMITPYFSFVDTSMTFVIDSGKFVDFTYRLYAQVGSRRYYYPKSKVAAVCKNGTEY